MSKTNKPTLSRQFFSEPTFAISAQFNSIQFWIQTNKLFSNCHHINSIKSPSLDKLWRQKLHRCHNNKNENFVTKYKSYIEAVTMTRMKRMWLTKYFCQFGSFDPIFRFHILEFWCFVGHLSADFVVSLLSGRENLYQKMSHFYISNTHPPPYLIFARVKIFCQV